MPTLPSLHHLTYTVADPRRSAAFYQALFGPGDAVERQGEGWTRIRVRWPNGLMLGFTRHETTPEANTFDPRRLGMDHAGFGCATEQEVRDWAARFDELGVPHGPIEEASYAVVVTGRDPDNIPVEFYWARAAPGPDPGSASG
jgi:glyoxylase I family protein